MAQQASFFLMADVGLIVPPTSHVNKQLTETVAGPAISAYHGYRQYHCYGLDKHGFHIKLGHYSFSFKVAGP